jgi:hypothetical protein
MCTSEGLSRFEVQIPEGLSATEEQAWLSQLEAWIGVADISDCFHRLRIDPALSRYFALPPMEARHLGLTSVDGISLASTDLVWPCLASLPMGFNWSMHFAQTAGENLLSQVDSLPRAALIQDHARPVVLNDGTGSRHYLYVDNLGIIALEREVVSSALQAGRDALERRGLLTHEASLGCGATELLGVCVDGESKRSSLTDRRYWRLDRGLEWLLRRGRASGIMVEAVMGHLTFAALVCRPALSCFHTVYAFIQNHYGSEAPCGTV